MMNIVALDRVLPQPWRNGGGVTRELLAWPSVADWQWRVSVADITQDGSFSAYPGVERWFAVTGGAGVVLRLAARRLMLTADAEPVHFNGAAAPRCELLDGSTQDLNLMVRQDTGRGAMQRALPSASVADNEWISSAPLRALYCTGEARLQIDNTDAARLPAGALAWSDQAARQRWRVLAEGSDLRAWWLWFQPRPD